MADLIWLPVTAAAYGAALLLKRRIASPLLNPTLVAMAALAGRCSPPAFRTPSTRPARTR
jgi:putative effector of murein hydrolase